MTESAKYLAVTIDSKLSFNQHMVSVRKLTLHACVGLLILESGS